MQVLQAANTGITSLQKLVDSAKSVANQALQTTVGYSTKSLVTTAAINGATADNLLGTATGTPTGGTVTAGAFTRHRRLGRRAALRPRPRSMPALSAPLTFRASTRSPSRSISMAQTMPSRWTTPSRAVSAAAVTGAELATAINTAIGGGSTAASFAAGHLTFTSPTAGAGGSLTITGTGGTAAAASGIADHAIVNGTAGGTADSLAFLGHGRWYASQRRA